MTEIRNLRIQDDLVVTWKKPRKAEDVARWIDEMEAAFPDRRIVVFNEGTEVRIESKFARTTNYLLAAAIVLQVIVIALRFGA